MAITFDEQYLLTVSEDGCLLTWKIIDKEGRGLKSNRQIIYSEAILVTKLDMEEKVCARARVYVCVLSGAMRLGIQSIFSLKMLSSVIATLDNNNAKSGVIKVRLVRLVLHLKWILLCTGGSVDMDLEFSSLLQCIGDDVCVLG